MWADDFQIPPNAQAVTVGGNATRQSTNMGILEIKNELRKFDKAKIIELIADLYKKNKSVKEYFDFFVNPNENELSKKYRDKIFDSFYPKRGFILKLKDAKQALADFKKLEPSTELLADLMLFYVECGVKFTNDFGDIDEKFYVSAEKIYFEALTLMHKGDFLEKFEIRSFKIVDDSNGIGWGFHDYLLQMYFNFYPYDDGA